MRILLATLVTLAIGCATSTADIERENALLKQELIRTKQPHSPKGLFALKAESCPEGNKDLRNCDWSIVTVCNVPTKQPDPKNPAVCWSFNTEDPEFMPYNKEVVKKSEPKPKP